MSDFEIKMSDVNPDLSHINSKTKSGVEDLSELYDIITKSKKDNHVAKCSTEDGRARAHARVSYHDNGQLSCEAGASAAVALKDGNLEQGVVNSKANVQLGLGGASVDAAASITYLQVKTDDGGIDLLKYDVAGGAGAGPGGVKAKVNAGVTIVGANAKFGCGQEVKGELRFNVDTGVEIGAGSLEVSVGGLGGRIGRTMAIKTPYGGLAFKLW